MVITLLMLFCILFATGIFLDCRAKIISFKGNESAVFLNAIAERGITLGSMVSEKHEFYAHPLWRNRNFVHKKFMSVGGEYFLYTRCGDCNPVIQVISKERALSSEGV